MTAHSKEPCSNKAYHLDAKKQEQNLLYVFHNGLQNIHVLSKLVESVSSATSSLYRCWPLTKESALIG